MYNSYGGHSGSTGMFMLLVLLALVLLIDSDSVISESTVQVQVEVKVKHIGYDPIHVMRVGTKTYPLPFDVKCDFENGSPIEAIRVVYSDGTIKYNVTNTERNRFLIENCK